MFHKLKGICSTDPPVLRATETEEGGEREGKGEKGKEDRTATRSERGRNEDERKIMIVACLDLATLPPIHGHQHTCSHHLQY